MTGRYVYSAAGTQRTGFEAYELVAERLDVGGQLADVWYPGDLKRRVLLGDHRGGR